MSLLIDFFIDYRTLLMYVDKYQAFSSPRLFQVLISICLNDLSFLEAKPNSKSPSTMCLAYVWYSCQARGVRPLPYLWQNLRFSLPYFWPDQKFDTLLMTLVHSCRKHKFVKGFCCWLYLAFVAGVKRRRRRQSAGGRRRAWWRSSFF